MTGLEALELLEKNMAVQSKNMQTSIDSAQKKLESTVLDKTVMGRVNQDDLAKHYLAHISFCLAQQSVYDELKEWSQAIQKEVVN